MCGMADGWSESNNQATAIAKTQLAIDDGHGGVMLFRTDMDTMNPSTSLLQAIRDILIERYSCNICQPPSTGDLNGDKMVTVADFAMIAEDFEIGNADELGKHTYEAGQGNPTDQHHDQYQLPLPGCSPRLHSFSFRVL